MKASSWSRWLKMVTKVRIPIASILLAASLAGAVDSRAEVGKEPIIGSEEQRVLDAEDTYVAADLSRDEAFRRIAAPEGTESVSTQRYTSTYVKRECQWRTIGTGAT